MSTEIYIPVKFLAGKKKALLVKTVEETIPAADYYIINKSYLRTHYSTYEPLLKKIKIHLDSYKCYSIGEFNSIIDTMLKMGDFRIVYHK